MIPEFQITTQAPLIAFISIFLLLGGVVLLLFGLGIIQSGTGDNIILKIKSGRQTSLIGFVGVILGGIGIIWSISTPESQLITPTSTVAVAESNSGKSPQQPDPTKMLVAPTQTPMPELPPDTPTPNPTNTPRPAPTATMDADPTVYDNFNNPAFDGKLNLSLWSPIVTSPSYIEQRGGVLALSLAPESGDGATLFPAKTFKLDQFNFAESKILLSSEKPGQNGDVGFALMTTDKKGQNLIFLCVISRFPPIRTWCSVYGRTHPDSEYSTETTITSYDVWHTVRIEMDPEINATFYIDGERVGSYRPNDAEEIKGKPFALRLEVWSPEQVGIEAHYDDVRIGQFR